MLHCVCRNKRTESSTLCPLLFSPATKMRCLTFPGVARVKSIFLRPGPPADAKQPGQDYERKKHGRESQGDLLWCWQNHLLANRQNGTRRDTRQKGGTAAGQKTWLQGRNVTRSNQYELKQCDMWDPKPGCSAENSCALPRCNRKHGISGKGAFRIIASADESKMIPLWLYFLKAAFHKVIYKCRISHLKYI